MPGKWKKVVGYWKPGRWISVTVGTGDCRAGGTSSTITGPIRQSPRCEPRLVDFPHDSRVHCPACQALQILNRTDEAHREAETVGRIRELLDPLTLGPQLGAALSDLDQPAAPQTLAQICDRVGLTRLAGCWREAGGAPQTDAAVTPRDFGRKGREKDIGSTVLQ